MPDNELITTVDYPTNTLPNEVDGHPKANECAERTMLAAVTVSSAGLLYIWYQVIAKSEICIFENFSISTKVLAANIGFFLLLRCSVLWVA